jgi:hypothetical protein
MRRIGAAILYCGLAGFTLVAFQNCSPLRPDELVVSSNGAQSLPTDPTFQTVQARILEPHCLACHNSTVTNGDLNFSSYQTLLQSGAIVPGSPETSAFLIAILNGSMPQGGPLLSDTDAEIVREWIAAGALESDPVDGDAVR